jgi:hypothetical protein
MGSRKYNHMPMRRMFSVCLTSYRTVVITCIICLSSNNLIFCPTILCMYFVSQIKELFHFFYPSVVGNGNTHNVLGVWNRFKLFGQVSSYKVAMEGRHSIL